MTNLSFGKIGSLFTLLLLMISLLFGFGSKPSEPIDPPAPPEKDTEEAEIIGRGSFDGFTWEHNDDGMIHVVYHADDPNAKFAGYKQCDGYEWTFSEKSLLRANPELRFGEAYACWSVIAFSDRDHGAITFLAEVGLGNRWYMLYVTKDGGKTWTAVKSPDENSPFIIHTSAGFEPTTFYLLGNDQCIYDCSNVCDVSGQWAWVIETKRDIKFPDPVPGQVWEIEWTELLDISDTEVTLKYHFRGIPEHSGEDTVTVESASAVVTLSRVYSGDKPFDPSKPQWAEHWDEGK